MVLGLTPRTNSKTRATATPQPDDTTTLPPAPDFDALVAAENAYREAVQAGAAFAERRRTTLVRLNNAEKRAMDPGLTPQDAAAAGREYGAAKTALDGLIDDAATMGDPAGAARSAFIALYHETAEAWWRHVSAAYQKLLAELHYALVAGWPDGAQPRPAAAILQELYKLCDDAEATVARWDRHREVDDPKLRWPWAAPPRPALWAHKWLALQHGGTPSLYEGERRQLVARGLFRLPEVDDALDAAEAERQARHRRQVQLDEARNRDTPQMRAMRTEAEHDREINKLLTGKAAALAGTVAASVGR